MRDSDLQQFGELLANPFWILKAEYSTTISGISDLLEDAEFEEEFDVQTLYQAQQSLVTPRERLVAEISWLPELSRSQIAKAMEAVGSSDHGSLSAEIDHFPEIAKANILAQALTATNHPDSLIQPLSNCWDSTDTTGLTDFLNHNRTIAGIPSLNTEQIEEALSGLSAYHAKVAADAIWGSGVPGSKMNSIVEAELARHKDGLFLKKFVREYDKNSESTLFEISDSIDNAALNCIPPDEKLGEYIRELSALLFQWDEINQPVQLFEQSIGHEEPRSRELFKKLRELCLGLANEHGCYEEALQLSEALLRTFPELESVAETLRQDVADLEDLLEQSKENEKLQPLIDACAAAKEGSFRIAWWT